MGNLSEWGSGQGGRWQDWGLVFVVQRSLHWVHLKGHDQLGASLEMLVLNHGSRGGLSYWVRQNSWDEPVMQVITPHPEERSGSGPDLPGSNPSFAMY